jgi:hypothetical protein
MKLALIAAVLMALGSMATAEPMRGPHSPIRLAAAASEVCLATCADQNATCKRVCPATFSTPCVSACDNQAQTCRAGCQGR